MFLSSQNPLWYRWNVNDELICPIIRFTEKKRQTNSTPDLANYFEKKKKQFTFFFFSLTIFINRNARQRVNRADTMAKWASSCILCGPTGIDFQVKFKMSTTEASLGQHHWPNNEAIRMFSGHHWTEMRTGSTRRNHWHDIENNKWSPNDRWSGTHQSHRDGKAWLSSWFLDRKEWLSATEMRLSYGCEGIVTA